MKKLLILKLCYFFILNSAIGIEFTNNLNTSKNPTEDFQSLNIDIEERLEQARLEAERIVALLAADNTYRANILHQQNIEKTYKTIQKLRFTWSKTGKPFGQCDPNTFAYVIKLHTKEHRNNIFNCPILLLQTFPILTQIIIHEAAHLGFEASECQATAFEVLSLHYSSFTEVYKTPYWKRCGTERLNQHFLNRI